MLIAMKSQAEPKTIEDRLQEFGETIAGRLAPRFTAATIPYPPARLVLIGLKQERSLEVHAAGPDGEFRFICEYPVLGASGLPGPKMREGDTQVPEGLYAIESLNPNSLFHLALRIGYPNEFDCARAEEEGRTEPGSDIMIHGGALSRGCLALGDSAAEELFVLTALTGVENVRVILAPADFRSHDVQPRAGTPPWTQALYGAIKAALENFPRTPL